MAVLRLLSASMILVHHSPVLQLVLFTCCKRFWMFSTVLLPGVVEHVDPSGKLKDKKTAILNDTLVCHFGSYF